MDLFVLRHGIAAEPGSEYPKDSERPLIPEGKRKLKCIAEAISEMELWFDVILSSPYVRARETAEIVADELKIEKRLQLTDALIPLADPAALVKLLQTPQLTYESILLVGHEPFLSRFVSLLVSGDYRASIELKKASLCKLSVQSLKAGRCATFEWLLTPKHMIMMS